MKERRHVSPFSWIGKNEDILLICHSNVCVWTRRGCHRSYLVSRFLTCFFPVRDCFSLGAFRPSVFSCFPFLFLFLFVYFYLFIFFQGGTISPASYWLTKTRRHFSLCIHMLQHSLGTFTFALIQKRKKKCNFILLLFLLLQGVARTLHNNLVKILGSI